MPATGPAPPLYPFRFRPVLKDYVWGGRNLESILGRRLPEGVIAESWEISDHPRGQTLVAEGVQRESSLGDILGRYGIALVGSRNAHAVERGRFPLLIKLLDASQWLSVQVHPGDDAAGEHQDDPGKTEMWVVLHAEQDAEIILGFDRATGRRAVSEALASGELNAILHRVPACRGDVFFVPAGTIHAIGPGLLLAEIQQSSDLTYRVYDWDRAAVDGRRRELHIAPALEVIDYSVVRPGPVVPTALETGAVHREFLAECRYFRTERVRIDDSTYRGTCDGSTFEIWALLAGSARIESRAGTTDLDPVSWLLLPASLGDFEVCVADGSELLRVFTPEV